MSAMQIDEKALEAARKSVKAQAIFDPIADVSTLADTAIRAYLEAATPPDELSGNPGELIDKMADAIRGDTIYDDTPWETLSEDRKVGWRDDAERALAVVKEYLTSQAATALRLSAGGGVPEGWKLVPVEPTFEMQIAGRDAIIDASDDDNLDLSTDDSDACYRAMLAASPTVEAGR